MEAWMILALMSSLGSGRKCLPSREAARLRDWEAGWRRGRLGLEDDKWASWRDEVTRGEGDLAVGLDDDGADEGVRVGSPAGDGGDGVRGVAAAELRGGVGAVVARVDGGDEVVGSGPGRLICRVSTPIELYFENDQVDYGHGER
ncbi:hypothetical protein GMORB2_2650 [Geosmithia morbida]|uniref:Uncharacterized protein n=1 Tax=Geosmithia morbida TaxID=1094350 RepID=A0A9P5CZL7_9HYPO|nr:uncharacterized protein GMORB2_2650 [Geosmithia morbida]KAF4120647.1 hypothetical protein GMORB2_2650 [Geosmithia morbida]